MPELLHSTAAFNHDDVMKWKHFPRYWPFEWGIHRSPVNSPHKGQWRGALMFSAICVWINDWVNNREAGDLRRHRAHCDVIVMSVCEKNRCDQMSISQIMTIKMLNEFKHRNHGSWRCFICCCVFTVKLHWFVYLILIATDQDISSCEIARENVKKNEGQNINDKSIPLSCYILF